MIKNGIFSKVTKNVKPVYFFTLNSNAYEP
jgi:hypothetical protein